MSTTNYTNTFIEAAEDCKAATGEAPPRKKPESAAQIEYEMMIKHPYQYTSDDVLYESNGNRRGLSREEFFAKGQPCFRASALCKRYGWGIHHNNESKVAMFALGTPEYSRLSLDKSVKHVKAMRYSAE